MSKTTLPTTSRFDLPGRARARERRPLRVRRPLRALGLLIALALAACGTVTYIVQQYAGEPRPNEEIAILRINGGEGPRVASLDGESLGPGIGDPHTRLHIEMLPGMHVVQVEERPGFYPAPKLRFSAEAGRVYRAVMATALVRGAQADQGKQGKLVPRVYEVDRDSDALIRDATWQPPRRAPAPREEPPGSRILTDAGGGDAGESEDAGDAGAAARGGDESSDAGEASAPADSGAGVVPESGAPPP